MPEEKQQDSMILRDQDWAGAILEGARGAACELGYMIPCHPDAFAEWFQNCIRVSMQTIASHYGPEVGKLTKMAQELIVTVKAKQEQNEKLRGALEIAQGTLIEAQQLLKRKPSHRLAGRVSRIIEHGLRVSAVPIDEVAVVGQPPKKE